MLGQKVNSQRSTVRSVFNRKRENLSRTLAQCIFASRSASTRSTVSTIACVCASTSTFTKSPTALSPSTVTRNVSGIKYTQNPPSPVVSPTVRLHPSIDTKPFCSTYFFQNGSESEKSILVFPSPVVTLSILAVVCTCPETVCPPISSPTRADRSKFTALPSRKLPRLVRLSVSSITSKVAVFPARSVSVTVRHVPLSAMDAPIVTVLISP
mmetsp:Transcript_9459/g.25686  ORF Transcript_9459/g.25686 Transcript_9459/m.25686 type:complete len:211 (-) Transcript_9459:1526-2158(-)